MKKQFKIILGILVALILGSVIGIGSAIWAYEKLANRGRYIKNGPWTTNLAVGSKKADIYVRAYVAVHGLLALNQTETIYYGARTDDKGEPLGGDKIYRIEGKAPKARWWSITVYGADNFLIPNELNRYSYNSNNVKYAKDGKFTIYLSKTRETGNWLPLGDQKKFELSLRLYNPAEFVRENPATVDLPHVIREERK